MTVDFDNSQRMARGQRKLRPSMAGLAIGLIAAIGSAHAGQVPVHVGLAQLAPAHPAFAAQDPARGVPASMQVETIDFRRGEGGAGKLIMRFSGDGAMPDLRTQGNQVVVDIAGAQLPAQLQRPMNVVDFATPVQNISASGNANGARVVLHNQGAFESMAYQTGRDFIVEILPRAASQQRAVGSASAAVTATAQSAAASRLDTPPNYRGRPVTFNFQDVPVRTVLQLIAEESNLNIVASDSVQGNVTLRLVSVPWDQALDIVLQSKSLDSRRSGNVVWVAPQTEIAAFEQAREDARINLENRAELVTEYIPISYASAEDLAKLMTEDAKSGVGGGAQQGQQAQNRGFLSPRGSISADRRTNTLLVIDIPQRLTEIRRLISELDKPVDQVVIESRIVIANENFARELGARFGVSGAKDNAYFSGNLEANTTNRNSQYNADQTNTRLRNQYEADFLEYQQCQATGGTTCTRPTLPTFVAGAITRGLMTNLPATGTGAGALALSILNAGHLLDFELSALQTEGRGEIISNPRIVTSNQREAVIRQGDQIGYLTMTGGAAGQQALPQVEFADAMLELKVTPTITNDGRVFLAMDIQKNDLSGWVSTGVGQVPQIATRQVTTAVLVEDGQTVVVGGVYEFNNQNDMRKVPFLADLPVLGNLFRHRNRSRSKAELLIFVTPRVIKVAQR